MLDLNGGPIELRLLTVGTNWLKIGSMLASELGGYFSPLPKGSTVSVHQGHPSGMAMQAPELIAKGVYHVAITSPTWMLDMAREGRGALGWGEEPLPLRSIAVLPHDDLFTMMVRKDLGITSIAQLKEQKVPLRISTMPIHHEHPAGWLLDAILAEYGMEIEDFTRWGGSVTYMDRQPNFMEKVPVGTVDRVDGIKSGALNAVFDEAIMTPAWNHITDAVDMTFLPIDPEVMDTLNKKYGALPKVMKAGRYRGQESDVLTVDFGGWTLFCRDDLPDRVAYMVAWALDRQKAQIEGLFRPGQGLTGAIDMSQAWCDTGLPLHPGAEQYFREEGYMS